jgi:hypothetical protein
VAVVTANVFGCPLENSALLLLVNFGGCGFVVSVLGPESFPFLPGIGGIGNDFPGIGAAPAGMAAATCMDLPGVGGTGIDFGGVGGTAAAIGSHLPGTWGVGNDFPDGCAGGCAGGWALAETPVIAINTVARPKTFFTVRIMRNSP